MANPFFSGRIPPGLADKIDAHLLTTGETRSELLIRLLRAEVSDDKNNNNSDNTAGNKNNDVLSDLITRVQKLEEAINNKPDNKADNIFISLAFHEDDDNLDNREKLVPVDNKLDNNRAVILQENRIAADLNPTQLADLIKIHECKKVSKAKSKKLLDLGMISEIGGDSILTKLGEAILAKHQT